MANLNGFNAATVEPSQDFDPIPAGKYLAVITDSERKPTKSGTGQYLQLSLQILEGPYKGRYVWARLNLHNPNPTTVQIARQELSAICRAVGVMQPTDSVELHNIPLIITVKLKKREDTGELTNEVRSYAKREAAASNIAPPQANNPPLRGVAETGALFSRVFRRRFSSPEGLPSRHQRDGDRDAGSRTAIPAVSEPLLAALSRADGDQPMGPALSRPGAERPGSHERQAADREAGSIRRGIPARPAQAGSGQPA